MANIIDSTYFVGDIMIAQRADKAVAEKITLFINRYEKEVLQKLLGYELYKDFTDAISGDTPDQKWEDLKDGVDFTGLDGKLKHWMGFSNEDKLSIISNYVYYWFQRSEITSSTGTGEATLNKENAQSASPGAKMQSAWMKIMEWVYELEEFLNVKKDDYPTFQNHCIPSDFRHTVNVFGI